MNIQHLSRIVRGKSFVMKEASNFFIQCDMSAVEQHIIALLITKGQKFESAVNKPSTSRITPKML